MKAAVLGKPIAHSLSPVLHRAAYGVLGLDWQYEAIELAEVDLPGFLAEAGSDWAGFSVTMPLKRVAFAAAVTTDEAARTTSACNTLVPGETGWLGYNTDVPGVEFALRAAGIRRLTEVTILGAGATAASAIAACRRLGADRFQIHARRAEAVAELRRMFASAEIAQCGLDAALADTDLLVNTVPAGAGYAPALPADVGCLFDVVYAPWPTALAASAVDRGIRVVGGLELLVAQAALQVQLMTGCDPESLPAVREAMTAAGRTEQVRRSG